MKKLFIFTLIGSTLIFAGLSLLSLKTVKVSDLSKEVVEGRVVWQQKACVECHTLFGNGGYNAPDLTKVVAKMGENGVASFLEKRPIIRTSKGKRHIDLNSDETLKVVSFLSFVNTIRIPTWPPKPLNSHWGSN